MRRLVCQSDLWPLHPEWGVKLESTKCQNQQPAVGGSRELYGVSIVSQASRLKENKTFWIDLSPSYLSEPFKVMS